MKIILINQSQKSMPRQWVQAWMQALEKELKKSKISLSAKEMSLVFLDPVAAKKMNFDYRGKNYATDVLSFHGDAESLGELLMCPQVLLKQAKEHGHSFRAELGYMLIHGVLHLLGYDHEKSKKEAQKMFKIQDQVFDSLCKKFQI